MKMIKETAHPIASRMNDPTKFLNDSWGVCFGAEFFLSFLQWAGKLWYIPDQSRFSPASLVLSKLS